MATARARLLTWATYQPGPLFWAARVLARVLPGERPAQPAPDPSALHGVVSDGTVAGASVFFTNPETTIRFALWQIGNGAVSPAQAAALQALVDDVKRSAAQ